MKVQYVKNKTANQSRNGTDAREFLLSGLAVKEKSVRLGGVNTTFLDGGTGTPVILLHGPGESALWWMRVIPLLIKTHRIIIPDLPGHGSSEVDIDSLNADWMLKWFDALVDICDSAPVLVGHLLGGAIATRYVLNNQDKIRQLVLVDSFGLGKFRPSPAFAFGLIKFLARPNQNTYESFLPHCLYDPSGFQKEMAENWQPFLTYNLSWSQDPLSSKVMKILMKQLAIPTIPQEKLAAIKIPTSLIWGRHDKALKLAIAEAASKSYGWPLYVIDNARDDPKIERPKAFVDALQKAINSYDSKKQKSVI